MRRPRIASLVAIAAMSLPLLAGTTTPVAASPRTTPRLGTQLAELKGSDTAAGDVFGCSVAISGTTAVVGASGHAKDAGRAYVFTKTAAGWKQAAELKGSDTVAGDLLRRLGGHLGHDRRRGCRRPRQAMPGGRTCSRRRRPAGSRPPS